MVTAPLTLDGRYVLSPRERQLLNRYLHSQKEPAKDGVKTVPQVGELEKDLFSAAAFRLSSRVFVGILTALSAADLAKARIAARAQKPSAPLVASKTRVALSLSSLLFFHRVLYRLFARLRLQLLHEKVRGIQTRHPRLYALLTSRYAPAVAASLAGLSLGIFPSSQLRVALAIYIASRASELAYSAADGLGLTKNQPAWLGSWTLFALAHAQLFHAFIFDRDCLSPAYASFIRGYAPEYLQPRPTDIAAKVEWPTPDQIVDALAEMAHLRWPPFVSPILHPNKATTLPPSVNPVITPISSRAHPALQHLSCALIHPSQTSCFMAYLRQNLLAFPQLGRFFALYYGALSILRIKGFFKAPVNFLNTLSKQILRTTIAITGTISLSWGSICLFQYLLPRSLLPSFRFFLGGLLGGSFQLLDQTPAGHANAMYAARASADSLWKVGVRRKWWRPVKGGDVLLFVAALAVYNVVYDLGRQREDLEVSKDRSVKVVRFLRGENGGSPPPSLAKEDDNDKNEKKLQ
ncbi:hypothetical protein DV738_g4626, partial [Chaetothyriales sp. CBS 135597]